MIISFWNGLKRGFKDFGESIVCLVNSILLTIVYVIGVGATSVIAKISKKKFLETQISRETKSYWRLLNLKKRPTETYYRQY